MKFKNRFDYIICVAVLHHIPSEKLQRQFLKNIHQALKPKSQLLISVWNRWQLRYRKYFSNPKPFKDMARSDLMTPWQQSGQFRFIHAFKPKGLKNLAQKAGFKKIKIRVSENIYLTAEK